MVQNLSTRSSSCGSPSSFITSMPSRADSPKMRVGSALATKGLPTRLDAVSLESLQYFEPYTENTFPLGLLQIVRGGDIIKLQQQYSLSQLRLHSQFGQSLIQLICRQGSIPNAVAMVRWLVDEAHLSLNVRDRHGRSPLHTACMSAADSRGDTTPCHREVEFGLIRFLLERAPELMLFEDNHGKLPLDFIAFQDHETWDALFDSLNLEDLIFNVALYMKIKPARKSHDQDVQSDNVAAALISTFSPNERVANIVSQVDGILHS